MPCGGQPPTADSEQRLGSTSGWAGIKAWEWAPGEHCPAELPDSGTAWQSWQQPCSAHLPHQPHFRSVCLYPVMPLISCLSFQNRESHKSAPSHFFFFLSTIFYAQYLQKWYEILWTKIGNVIPTLLALQCPHSSLELYLLALWHEGISAFPLRHIQSHILL